MKMKNRSHNTIWIDQGLDMDIINPLSAKLTKWPNTLKQFVGNLRLKG